MTPRIPLARLARASGVNSKRILIRPIRTPATLAGELARINAFAATSWADARSLIMTSYERSLAEMMTDSAADTASVIDEISDATRRLVLTLTPRMRAWATRVEQWHRDKWIGAVLTPTRVDLSTMLTRGDVTQTIETMVARNVGLVRDVSSQARNRIADSVFRGLQKRTPARDVAREIAQATGLARARAIRIASDQTVKLSSALDQERQQQAGIERFVWQHSAKANPREEHLELDGQEFDYADPPEDMPGDLPFCGCVAGAILSLDD